jgi:hypothetical protein
MKEHNGTALDGNIQCRLQGAARQMVTGMKIAINGQVVGDDCRMQGLK